MKTTNTDLFFKGSPDEKTGLSLLFITPCGAEREKRPIQELRIKNYELRIKLIPHSEFLIPN